MVHTGLDDRRFMSLLQTEEGQRSSDVVIEIALGFQGVVFCAQHSGHHFLCGGLSHAAGDLNHRDLKAVPPERGQRPQGQTGIRDLNVELIGAQRLRSLCAKTACRALFQGGVDKIVAVKLLTHPRQEQAPLRDLSAVGAHLADGGRTLPGIQPRSSHGGDDLLDRQLHKAQPLLFK